MKKSVYVLFTLFFLFTVALTAAFRYGGAGGTIAATEPVYAGHASTAQESARTDVTETVTDGVETAETEEAAEAVEAVFLELMPVVEKQGGTEPAGTAGTETAEAPEADSTSAGAVDGEGASGQASVQAEAYSGFAEAEGSPAEKYLKEADSCFYMLPENVRNSFINNGWRIIVTTERDLDGQYFGGAYGSVAGVTVGSEKTIYIEARETSSFAVPMHEIGHAVDLIAGRPSQTQEFLRIYESEKDSSGVSAYDKSSAGEYWAECFSWYFLRTEQLRAGAPATCSFIENIIGTL